MQANRVAERVLRMDLKAARRKGCWAWRECLKPQSPHPVAHLLERGHTHFKKATPLSPFKQCHSLMPEHQHQMGGSKLTPGAEVCSLSPPASTLACTQVSTPPGAPLCVHSGFPDCILPSPLPWIDITHPTPSTP